MFVQHAGVTEAGSNGHDVANTFQSASLLPFHHGHSLNHDVAQADALYALSEVFRFCAFSESQFINLISHILEQQRHERLEELAKTLSNLTYYKRILDSHAERLKVIISCLMAGGGQTWPRATDVDHRAIVEATITVLTADFEQLAHRIDLLSKQCADDSLFLMNRVVVTDTKRGYIQAQNTANLTLLAFYFIPLTLITSFFGMNFKEIQGSDGPKLSLWVFFVMAVPSLFLAWIGFKYLRKLGPNRDLAL
jgi:Mg2+ and Co2+ transporter CorA